MAPQRRKLATYRAKRDFTITPEPPAKVASSQTGHSFLIQKHAATRLHYDFRLELDGVLKSWAVTRGPSLDPHERRLAVEVEDHPLAYGSFEGIIPKGQYGGGTVMLWDTGTWEPIGDPKRMLAKGKLNFRLHGKRLKGEWTLVRMQNRREKRTNWLLIKRTDQYAKEGDGEGITERYMTSVVSGKKMERIAADQPRVWQSKEAKKSEVKRSITQKKSPVPKLKTLRAQASTLPQFIPPQLATLSNAMPTGAGWVHEIKFDGYRIQVRLENGKVQLLTRTGKDWSDKFPVLAALFRKLPAQNAIIDGEVVAVHASGVSSFKGLQNALQAGDDRALQFYAFDLLFLDGENLMKRPLLERKALLEPLLTKIPNNALVFYSEHFEAQDERFLAEACRMRLEGVISKRKDAPYRSGRDKIWLKSKCHMRQEFVIGGFTLPTKGGRGVGALLLGYYQDDQFAYAGKVGTGFTNELSVQVRQKLEKLRQDSPPYDVRLETSLRRGVYWVTPKLVCEVEFTEWTPDGRLRHPSFQGLREDKPATSIRRDVPVDPPKTTTPPGKAMKAHATSNSSVTVAGITISHPDRLLYPEQKISKRMVAAYYEAVAEHILPHIKQRPLSIIRCPDDIGSACFFQRHRNAWNSPDIYEVRLKSKPHEEPYIMIKDIKGLISLVQWGVLELHSWGSCADKPEIPNHIIFDLDPDPEVAWKDVVAAAKEVRERMKELKLESFLKTTGGKGLHVTVPITRKYSWDVIKPFTKAIAEAMAHDSPDRFTSNMSKAKRKGRIFVDYLRNDLTSTAIAPFSLRARPGATVATPLAWEELTEKLVPAEFHLASVPKRLAKLKRDPWKEFFSVRQSITVAHLKKLGLKV